jgi:hypothetical protein
VDPDSHAKFGRTRANPWPSLLAGFAFITLALMAPGNVSSDGASMLGVATSLVGGHGFAVPCAEGIPGRGGQCFSPYYPLQSVLAAPFIAVGHAFAERGSAASREAGRFAAQGLPALAAAGVAAFTAYFALLLGAPRRRAVLAGVTIIFATEVAVYYRSFFAETLATLFVCVVIAGFLRNDRWRAVAPVAIVALILTKPQLVLVGLVLGAIFSVLEHRRRPLVEGVAATVVGTLVYAGYNVLRFSDVTDFGGDARVYHAAALAPLRLIEAAGLLVASPGRGWLIYSPIVILGFVGAWRLRAQPLAIAAVGVLVAVAVPYLGNPGSGFEWGSRYLVPAIPAFVALAWAAPAPRWAAPALAILGLVIVAPTFVSPYERAYAEQTAAGHPPSALYWSVARAPLLDIWGSAGRQIEAARHTDVKRLLAAPDRPPPGAGAVAAQRSFRIVAQWWWLAPAAHIARPLGLAAALLLLAAGATLLVRASGRVGPPWAETISARARRRRRGSARGSPPEVGLPRHPRP